MRHRRQGRVLGRSPSHRRALLRNLASALFLTERPDSEFDVNPPKVKGRIITTVAKAKEVRPLVERCITLAKRGRAAETAASEFATKAERHTEPWKQWREGPNYSKWLEASAPAVFARRRLIQLLCDKQAVRILFDELAERFEDRSGGYTRILRLATPRLGDAGPRAILEFVGKHDRVVKRSEKPDFGSENAASAPVDESQRSAGRDAAESQAAESQAGESQAGESPDEAAQAHDQTDSSATQKNSEG